MNEAEPVRVRFAPSPTGYLHVGGARTAFFNFLFARHHNGKFLLRIEDTDLERSDAEMTEAIFRSLRWLNLDWDEEPVSQSSCTDRHRDVCRKLVETGWAYRCFCSPEELREKREKSQKETGEYRYDRRCLGLSDDDVQDRLNRGMSYAIRFHVPEGETTFDDAVRGTVTVQNKEMDDFILLRSDDTPVYQMAVVVDDHDMGITHVIRGDDHLSNTPKQILIYQAMNWEVPVFAHLPMILGPDKKRLSKRHGATSVEEYKKAGYLPQAMINFLALLGWSLGDDREIMSINEMIEHFSLDRVSKNPAVWDEAKLTWMNGQYIYGMSEDELVGPVIDHLKVGGLIDESFMLSGRDYILGFIRLMKERVKTLGDFVEKGRYFFQDPDAYEENAVNKHWRKESVEERLKHLETELQTVDSWNAQGLEQVIRGLAEKLGVGAGKLIHPLRLALTGAGASPGIFELMEVLGRERVMRRLHKAIDYLCHG